MSKGSRQRVSTTSPYGSLQHREERITTYSSGPLPNSHELAEYNKIVENAAERLLSAYEGSLAHSQRMDEEAMGINKQAVENETLHIQLQSNHIRRAQWLTAFIVCATLGLVATLFALTCWLFISGKQLPAVAFLVLSAIVSLAGGNRLFVWIGAKGSKDKT